MLYSIKISEIIGAAIVERHPRIEYNEICSGCVDSINTLLEERMKIRKDFVTNSSSSSFMCIAKIDMCDGLKEYMKEEFGKFGQRLLEKYVFRGSDIRKHDEMSDFFEEYPDKLDRDAYYLGATFVEWTNEGETEDDDAFLYRNIPEMYKTELMVEEC